MLLPVKATHQRTREHNVRLVLQTLAELGPISRADIARRTRLTRTTVSDVMVELFADGLVEEVGRGPSSGGKAPILLRVPRDARQLIGVDVGDGQVRGAIVNLAGEITTARKSRSVDATARRRWSASSDSSTDSSAGPEDGRWASASAHRASSTPRPGRCAGRSISTGATCPLAPACVPGPGCPSTSPTTRRLRRWPSGRSVGTPRRAA